MSLRKKIMLCALTPVCVLGIIVIVIAITSLRQAIIGHVENALKGTAVAVEAAYDQNVGSYIQASNGSVWKGSYNISKSENLVDEIKEKSGMEITFFFGSQRIMTSALDENGQRILGSPAGEKITEQVLNQGQDYFSSNVLLDKTTYYGYFVPVYQPGDKTTPVGMVFAGCPKQETLASSLGIIVALIITVILIVLICIVTVVVVASSLTRRLKRGIVDVQLVSEGRLDIVFDKRLIKKKDEIGDLMRALSHLQDSLCQMVGDLSKSTDMLVEESDFLKQTSHVTLENIDSVQNAVGEITEGATSQANDTKYASENIEHMGELVIETGKQAEELGLRADQMLESSDKTTETIGQLKKISGEVENVVAEIARLTEQTNDSANSIGQASAFISDIADQTNLLALNASIEAARAGETGRGFAVVATEIQKLAEQSNNASGEIDSTVHTLIANSAHVVESMQRMQEVINNLKEHISATENTVGEVVTGINASIGGIRSIEDQAKELEKARKEIVTMIISLSRVAENNVTGTEETNAAIEEVHGSFRSLEESAQNLKGTADLLSKNIGSFKM
ncbi:MAG: methyl-accepting chemotaxis protein [Roseburia sp.]|nr:methyl-accepting chemotaxis protein [Roseburia sp.]